MLCEKCQKNPAIIHMKGLVNGAMTEFHLCQECSFNMVNMEMPIPLENIFKGILESVQSMGGIQATIGQSPRPAVRKAPGPCTVCGLSYEQFKSTGKLGCEACYQAFPKEIVALFKNVQGGSSHHEGKFPKRFGSQMRHQREVDKLRTALKLAIDDENFEEAASIRDQIRSLEVTS